MNQKKLDEVYINIAKQVSSLSHCVRTKVGAVLVKDGNVISMGYNGTPSGMDNSCEIKNYADPSDIAWLSRDQIKRLWPLEDENGNHYKLLTKQEVLHAEMNAIVKAAKIGYSVDGSTLYLTLSPCIDCSKIILQSGIKRVIYLEAYRNIDGINFLKQFIEVNQYDHL